MSEITVFVSGCYDILHGGHVEFFTQARALGTRLVVCAASDEVIAKYKGRKPALSQAHRVNILKALRVVDEIVIGDDAQTEGINFKDAFLRIRPHKLVVTEDDKYEDQKRKLCQLTGTNYVKLPKTLLYEKISTTEVRNLLGAPKRLPLRVDFAGGWLDVPKFSIPGSHIVNCAVEPMVSTSEWLYQIGGGLGGSAAYSLLLGKNAVATELEVGVGWQDPAIISETGWCSWLSGHRPCLDAKIHPGCLRGLMALYWTGERHYTPDLVDNRRDYEHIRRAGQYAHWALIKTAQERSLAKRELKIAIGLSYEAQLLEGMKPLPECEKAVKKYCGSGFGGYALYLFDSTEDRQAFLTENEQAMAIEPHSRV